MNIINKNIKKLIQVEDNPPLYKAGKEMSQLNTIDDAWLFIKEDKIASYGTMAEKERLEEIEKNGLSTVIDASNKMVMPAFCDSHTHIVYDGSREIEYIDKIKGLSYEEIAKRGGGF